jgi:glutathione S-transferase
MFSSYVLFVSLGSVLVGVWHGLLTGKYRGRAKVVYPHCYASSERIASAPIGPPAKGKPDATYKPTKVDLYLFNCAQRAHANFVEHHTGFLTTLLIAGLKYPTAAAGLGLTWTVGRIIYAIGYMQAPARGKYAEEDLNVLKGRKRLWGSFYEVAHLGLLILAGMSSWKLVQGEL